MHAQLYYLTLYHTILSFTTAQRKKALENIVKKGEMLTNQHFFPFPSIFSKPVRDKSNHFHHICQLEIYAYNFDD